MNAKDRPAVSPAGIAHEPSDVELDAWLLRQADEAQRLREAGEEQRLREEAEFAEAEDRHETKYPAQEDVVARAPSGAHTLSMPSKPPLSSTYENPYAVTRPEYHLVTHPPVPGSPQQLTICNGDGETVAELATDVRDMDAVRCDARMLASAGKMHWALGSTVPSLKGFVQDLSVLTSHEMSQEQLKKSLLALQADIQKLVNEVAPAYVGPLLDGHEAADHDNTWRQDGQLDDDDLIAYGEFEKFAARHPNFTREQFRALGEALPMSQGKQERLALIAQAKADAKQQAANLYRLPPLPTPERGPEITG